MELLQQVVRIRGDELVSSGGENGLDEVVEVWEGAELVTVVHQDETSRDEKFIGIGEVSTRLFEFVIPVDQTQGDRSSESLFAAEDVDPTLAGAPSAEEIVGREIKACRQIRRRPEADMTLELLANEATEFVESPCCSWDELAFFPFEYPGVAGEKRIWPVMANKQVGDHARGHAAPGADFNHGVFAWQSPDREIEQVFLAWMKHARCHESHPAERTVILQLGDALSASQAISIAACEPLEHGDRLCGTESRSVASRDLLCPMRSQVATRDESLSARAEKASSLERR